MGDWVGRLQALRILQLNYYRRCPYELRDPEGRAYAFQLLTRHPEYRVKGLRWHPGPYEMSECEGPGNPEGYTTYQVVVDSIRGVVEHDRAQALSLIADSKSLAGDGDWATTARTIKPAIRILEQLARDNPTPYEQDLAVALFHQEAFLGQQGYSDAARASVEQAIGIFSRLARSDPAYKPDLAKSLASYAYTYTDEQDWARALAAITPAVSILQELARSNPAEYELELAQALLQKSEMQFQSHDVDGAVRTIRPAVELVDRMAGGNHASDPALSSLVGQAVREKASALDIAVAARRTETSTAVTATERGNAGRPPRPPARQISTPPPVVVAPPPPEPYNEWILVGGTILLLVVVFLIIAATVLSGSR